MKGTNEERKKARMKVRIVITGSPTFHRYPELQTRLLEVTSRILQWDGVTRKDIRIVTMGSHNVSKLGEWFAVEHCFAVCHFQDDEYDKAMQYAASADGVGVLCVFWDEKDEYIAEMMHAASKMNLRVLSIRVQTVDKIKQKGMV